MVHMPRAKLKECIESGITRTRDPDRDWLSDEDAAKLRDVGETITHVAYGNWCQSNSVSCGCPLVEAGLVNLLPDSKPVVVRSEYTRFATWYDSAVVWWGLDAGVVIGGTGIIVVEEEIDV